MKILAIIFAIIVLLAIVGGLALVAVVLEVMRQENEDSEHTDERE